MTPTYILEVLASRGIKTALKVADATQDPRLIQAVMVENFRKTGIARPLEVMGRNKRGKEVILRFFEGATPAQLEAVKDELARRKAKSQPLAVPYGAAPTARRRGGKLTNEELARRAAVLAQAA